MTDKNINTQFPVIFQKLEEFEKEDSRFVKVRIWLMHTELNLNGSFFSKEVVEKAIPSLSNTPLLSFIEENSDGEQDFSDHRMVLHRSEDGGLSTKYIGSAVGTIPETNNAHWEKRVTDMGTEKEYLVVDALMWTKWGDPTDIMISKGTTAQSMELSNDYSGTFDESGVFHFETFSFFGACLLGDGVNPAMSGSTVEVQFTENNAIQKSIENKLQEFYTLFSQQGGTQMEELPKVEETTVEATPAETNLKVNEDGSVLLGSEGKGIKISSPEASATFSELSEGETVLPLTEAQFETETVEAVESELETVEVFEENVEVTEVVETVESEVAEVEEETEVEDAESVEVIDYEAKFNLLQSQFEAIQSELDTLKSYKRTREEDDIKAKFADKLSEEEFTEVFSKMKESTIEDVEDKLFALYGKKNFSMQKPNTTKINKVVIASRKDDEKSYNPYGDIFED